MLNKDTHVSLPSLFPKVLETRSRELNQKQEKQLQTLQLLTSENTSVQRSSISSSSSVAVIKHPAKSNLGQRQHIWLTIPSHSLLQQRSKGGSVLNCYSHHMHNQGQREKNTFVHTCLLALSSISPLLHVYISLGNDATHNRQTFSPQLMSSRQCPIDTPPDQPT